MNKDSAVRMGNAIRRARQACELTQEDVACRLGVSVEFYSRIERGHAHPSIDTLLRMMVVLNASADMLLGIEDMHHAEPSCFPLTTSEDSPLVDT